MKKRFSSIKLYSCLIVIIISALMPFKVLAKDVDFYSSNNIMFYDPSDTNCTSVSSTAAIDLKSSDTIQLIFQLLINGGMNAGQTAAIMGNMYRESEFKSDALEDNKRGYGLVQWSFDRRTELESFAAKKGVPASDIPMQIEFLLKEYNDPYYRSRLDASAFKDSTDIAASTKAWMLIFEAPLMKPLNDPAALNSVRIPAAIKVYGLYSNLAPNPTTASDGCNNSGNGAVANNMIATALNFALTTPATNGMTAKSDARSTYQTAKEQYNPSVDWTDCGGFIATVMIASGVDPNYVNVSVIAQYNYVKSHPEKYLIINNPKASDLQPGDILISSGHTTMYTGQSPYPDVDASLNGRVPSVQNSGSHVWMINHGAVIARVLK